MNDLQLIQEYAISRSDEAFKALIDQYVGLVYSACFRQLKDRHLAEDATQAVFLLLSQKAGTLRPSYLTGWLLTTCRYACRNIRASEQRRACRERLSAINPTTQAETRQDDLLDLLDLLDEALAHLKAADREALVLRYLREQPLSNVAQRLGVSEEAARKRIGRGVEKLRKYFGRRGIVTSSTALGAILTEQVSGAALTTAARHSITQGIIQVCEAGAHGTTASVAIAKGTQTMMTLTKLKTAAAVAAIAAAVGTTGWMISLAAADTPAAPENAAAVNVAAPAAQVPVVSTPMPAPKVLPSVVLDLSTPENAARSFFDAVREGDRAKAYQCLTADPDRPPNLMDGILAWNIAQNHLVRVVVQAFGGNGEGVKHLITIDTIAWAIVPNPKLAPQSVIHGETATMTTSIPSWVIAMAPANYQTHIRDWSGKTLYFQKQAGQWKFDIDRSMRVECMFMDNNHHPFNSEAKTAIFLEGARVTEQVASAVVNGQITSSDGATDAIDTARSRMMQDFGISSGEFNILPAEGGN
jgi:RNA polymerase sigma factor (sigma-70 family)